MPQTHGNPVGLWSGVPRVGSVPVREPRKGRQGFQHPGGSGPSKAPSPSPATPSHKEAFQGSDIRHDAPQTPGTLVRFCETPYPGGRVGAIRSPQVTSLQRKPGHGPPQSPAELEVGHRPMGAQWISQTRTRTAEGHQHPEFGCGIFGTY